MNFQNLIFYIFNLWNKVFDFKGREKRREYFLTFVVNFVLFVLVYTLLSSIFADSVIIKNLLFLFGLVFVFAANTLSFRRLNDVGIPFWQNIAHFALTYQGRNLIGAIKVPAVYLFFTFLLLMHGFFYIYLLTRPSLEKNKSIQI